MIFAKLHGNQWVSLHDSTQAPHKYSFPKTHPGWDCACTSLNEKYPYICKEKWLFRAVLKSSACQIDLQHNEGSF